MLMWKINSFYLYSDHIRTRPARNICAIPSPTGDITSFSRRATAEEENAAFVFSTSESCGVCAECSATEGEQLQRVRLPPPSLPPSLPPSQSKSSVQKTCTFAWLIFRVGGGIGSGLEGRKKPIESCISVPVWELAFRFTYSSTFRYKYNPVCIYISQLGVSCEHMFKPTCLSPLWIWKTEHQLRYWKHDIPLWKASAAL